MKKMSNASFYASWNSILGKTLFESCNHSSCVEIKHLDQKTYFSSFFFPPSHKAQLFACYKYKGSTSPFASRCPAHLIYTVFTYTNTSIRTLFLKYPPSQTPSKNSLFNTQFPVSSWNTLPSIASVPPPAPSKVTASQITPLGDQSYTESF